MKFGANPIVSETSNAASRGITRGILLRLIIVAFPSLLFSLVGLLSDERSNGSGSLIQTSTGSHCQHEVSCCCLEAALRYEKSEGDGGNESKPLTSCHVIRITKRVPPKPRSDSNTS